MKDNQNQVKFRLVERALEIFRNVGVDVKNYGNNPEKNSLQLRNAGPELTLYGRNKAVALEVDPLLIPTGILLALKPGQVASIKATTDLAPAHVTIRDFAFEHTYDGEIFVSFINVGESDVTIPEGAILPARLFVTSCASSFKIISDLEYLEEKSLQGNVNAN